MFQNTKVHAQNRKINSFEKDTNLIRIIDSVILTEKAKKDNIYILMFETPFTSKSEFYFIFQIDLR